MGEVTLQSQNWGLISYRLTFLSLHVNRPSHSWDTAFFQNLTLKIKGQGQKTMMLHNYRSRQFHRTSNGINPFSGFRDMGSASAAWFYKFLAHGLAHMGQITMTVHNYRSRQVHETLNGVNPSSRFRDLCSAKSGPNLCQIWQVFGPWASPYGANGQMTMPVHN